MRDQSPTWALPDFTEEIGVERREKRYLVIELTSGWYGWRFLEAVGYSKYAQMRCKRMDGPKRPTSASTIRNRVTGARSASIVFRPVTTHAPKGKTSKLALAQAAEYEQGVVEVHG